MKKLLIILCFFIGLSGCKNTTEKEPLAYKPVEKSHFELNITPISHATMVLEWDDIILYTDPIGGGEAF